MSLQWTQFKGGELKAFQKNGIWDKTFLTGRKKEQERICNLAYKHFTDTALHVKTKAVLM